MKRPVDTKTVYKFFAVAFLFMFFFLVASGLFFFRRIIDDFNNDKSGISQTHDRVSADKFDKQKQGITEATNQLDELIVMASEDDEKAQEKVLKAISDIRIDLEYVFDDASFRTFTSWQDTNRELESIETELLAGVITPFEAVEKASDLLNKKIQYD